MKQTFSPICFSLAWDWYFKGITEQFIAHQSKMVHRIALQNRDKKMGCLDFHEGTIARFAARVYKDYIQSPWELPWHIIATTRGILPTFQEIVEFHNSVYNEANGMEEFDVIKDAYAADNLSTMCYECMYELTNHYIVYNRRGYCLRCYKDDRIVKHKTTGRKRQQLIFMVLCHLKTPIEEEKEILNGLKRLI